MCSFPNYEFRGQISGLVHYIGGKTSGSSFKGFLEEIIADNSLISYYFKVTQCTNCAFNYYTDPLSGSCTACSSACPT